MNSHPASPLWNFAAYLRQQNTMLTEKWMDAVSADPNLVEADRLTYEEMADHLPKLLEEICNVLDARDLGWVESAIERDAVQHGKVRWQQGYRVDELVLELELFRKVLVSAGV